MDFEKVEISAVVIVRDRRILAVFNPAWGSFTLPMTKRRVLQGKKVPTAPAEETWEHAAARAYAEVIGKTVSRFAKVATHTPGLTQGDRTGEVKNYQIETFRCDLPSGIEPRSDVTTEWLTLDEWLDPQRMPISPTAVHILKFAQAEATQSSKSFP